MESKEQSETPSVSEIKEDFKLKVEINKWEQKTNKFTGKLEVIFNIELFSEITNKKWSVYHSILDFKELISNLSSICINIPDYPGFKSLEKEKSSSSIINKASSAIIEFVNSISYRSDIFNSNYYIEFFKLENHFDDLKKNEPKEKMHINDLKHEISDIILLEKLDLLIVGCAHDLSQNILSKINFWNKKDKKGQINIYKLNNNQEQNYILFGQIDTDNEISCLNVSENKKKIFVGYFNGTIEVFDLPEFSEIQQNPSKLVSKNIIEISNKKNRIISIGYDSLNDYYYTACYKDIMVYIGKSEDKAFELSIPGSEYDLCGFNYIDKYNDLNDFVIEMDIKGKIYIGQINKNSKLISLLFVLTDQITQISLFKVSFEYNHIYIGDKDGNLDILYLDIIKKNENEIKTQITRIFNASLSKNSQNKFTNIISRNFPYKINDIWYNPKKKELLVALNNGTIQIFSHFKNFAEYIIYIDGKNKDNKSINKIYFNKLDSILYFGRSEKDVYIYQMPEIYNSEISRKLQDSNAFGVLNGSKIYKNAIDRGHPKTTEPFKKKNIIEVFRIKKEN